MNDDGTATPGISIRTRTVVYPPRRGGNECPPLSETKKCNTIPCRHKDFNEQKKANFKGIKANQVGVFNNNFIHVSEIEVYDVTGKNIARGKKTSQSSNASGDNSGRVVDGVNTPNNWNSTQNRNNASNKKFNSNEWVIVDLGGTFEIIKVVIKNRTSGGSAPGRLKGAQVILMNKDGAEVYLVQPGDAKEH